MLAPCGLWHTFAVVLQEQVERDLTREQIHGVFTYHGVRCVYRLTKEYDVVFQNRAFGTSEVLMLDL